MATVESSSFRDGSLAGGGGQDGSRRTSLDQGSGVDLALLRLASSASADLRYRRAESLLPCGLTQDELNELLGRFAGPAHVGPADAAAIGAAAEVPRAGERKGSGAVPVADICGGVQVGSGGPAGGEPAGSGKAAGR